MVPSERNGQRPAKIQSLVCRKNKQRIAFATRRSLFQIAGLTKECSQRDADKARYQRLSGRWDGWILITDIVVREAIGQAV